MIIDHRDTADSSSVTGGETMSRQSSAQKLIHIRAEMAGLVTSRTFDSDGGLHRLLMLTSLLPAASDLTSHRHPDSWVLSEELQRLEARLESRFPGLLEAARDLGALPDVGIHDPGDAMSRCLLCRLEERGFQTTDCRAPDWAMPQS